MAKSMEELNEQILESFENISLSEEEKELINNNPTLLASIWGNTSRSILLRYFPAIMQSQVNKAINGDTAAAKFLTDFAQPTDTNEQYNATTYKWEQPALELRDRLNLDCSAEDLVCLILQQLATMPTDSVTTFIQPA